MAGKQKLNDDYSMFEYITGEEYETIIQEGAYIGLDIHVTNAEFNKIINARGAGGMDAKKEGSVMNAGPVDKAEQNRQTSIVKSQSVQGKSQSVQGISQSVQGESQSVQGISQSVQGESQSVQGKSQMIVAKKEVANRKVFVMRHGERLDRVFPSWMQLGWTEGGRYKPYDLNMPMSLPSRANYYDYSNDTPLTEVGYTTSQMCGRAMRMSRQRMTQIYSSPGLRCLQSAQGLLKMARKDATVQIQVEPGLFEWLGWYKDEMPTFMTLDECAKYGYEVNRDYKPIITVEQLKSQASSETIEAYYKRSNTIMKTIIEKHPDSPCNILVLCHAPSLDACCRELCGKKPSLPTNDQMSLMGVHFPYCSIVALEELDKSWSVAERLLPSITYYNHSNQINAQFFNRP